MSNVTILKDQTNLVNTGEYPNYATFPFEQFNPVQSRIFEVYNKEVNCIIAAATSAGKAQPLRAPVLTLSGYKAIGNIQVGDEVIGSDGLAKKVSGVFPQGVKRVYKVCFSDGAAVECCEDHLWNVRTRHDKHRERDYKTKSLKELFGDLKLKDGQNKWFVPLLEPKISKEVQTNFPIHPYVLGVLLGDGGIIHRVTLSTGDDYILNRVSNLLPTGVLIEHIDNYDYQIVGGMKEDGVRHGFKKTNLIKHCLELLGLFGLSSCEKFIPQIYLDAEPHARLELLRGLMDANGTANGPSKAAEFTSCSKTLAEGVCKLARSLGAACRVRRGKSGYKNDEGIYVECEDRYRVTVNLGSINPFSIPRKALYQGVGLKKGRNRSIERIEILDESECVCISVDSIDNLYVTSDYVLTHNTVCAEMFMAQEVRERGGKAMYLAPLRALAKEKIDDWTNPDHHFADQNLSICTGDYRLTPERKKELEAANVILMTSEMLNARARNYTTENNEFLKSVGTLVVDESHLLTVAGRGDHLEVGLMKFCQVAPDARIVFLSATMPNVDEIAKWVAETLTGRDTHLINSTYRPCPLGIHWTEYDDSQWRYEAKEEEKIKTSLEIIDEHSDDRFLVFVHTKRTGQKMLNALKKKGIECEYHSADLDKAKRHKVEDRFRSGNLRVIVATSTLAWGLNMPARRVIITGVHRGLSEVETYDIWQMAGRAGRPGYDPRGDVYILLPKKKFDYHQERLEQHTNIESQLLEYVGTEEKPHYKILAFHLVSEIHHNTVNTKEDIHEWYNKSLANFQANDLDDHIVDSTLELLQKRGAVRVDENGKYQVTATGRIASMFYYSPFDVADLKKNFAFLFNEGLENNDVAVSISLGAVDSMKMGFASKAEQEEMASYSAQVRSIYGGVFTDAAIKGGYAYFMLMNGLNSAVFNALCRNIQFDYPRTGSVLMALDSMAGKWDEKEFWKTLQGRLVYGVPAHLVPLCKIPSIGKVRAEKLWAAGLKDAEAVAASPAHAQKVLNMKDKVFSDVISGAKAIELTKGFG